MNELIVELRARGVKFKPEPSMMGMYLFPPDIEDSQLAVAAIREGHSVTFFKGVEVFKSGSREAARDGGGSRGDKACSWGRFVFHGHKDMIAEIKRKTGAKS